MKKQKPRKEVKKRWQLGGRETTLSYQHWKMEQMSKPNHMKKERNLLWKDSRVSLWNWNYDRITKFCLRNKRYYLCNSSQALWIPNCSPDITVFWHVFTFQNRLELPQGAGFWENIHYNSIKTLTSVFDSNFWNVVKCIISYNYSIHFSIHRYIHINYDKYDAIYMMWCNIYN